MHPTANEVPATVLRAMERLARHEASGSAALDDLDTAGWDAYRTARERFLAGLDVREEPWVLAPRGPLALPAVNGR